MRLPPIRFSIRSFLVGLAVATVLAAGGVQARRWVRLRPDYLRQVESYRLRLGEAERSLDEYEAGAADPEDQALLAKLPENERAAWVAEGDQIRRSREVYAEAIPRWQRLADHPWEPRPADLYRVD